MGGAELPGAEVGRAAEVVLGAAEFPRAKNTEAQAAVDATRSELARSAGSCPVCRQRAAVKQAVAVSGRIYRRCDTCGNSIPRYIGMQGAGFQSHTVDHFHQSALDVGRGKRIPIQDPVMRELCYDCYLADFAAFYPGEPLPVIANVEEALGR